MSLFIPSNGSRGLKILQEQPHFKGNSLGLAGPVSPWASAAGSGAGQPIRAHLIRINRSFLKRKGKANKPFDRGESLVYCEGGNSTGIIHLSGRRWAALEKTCARRVCPAALRWKT
jgi:hypothetical protein